MTALRLYLGGSFDPVHIGHLRVAIEVAERLDETVRILPVAEPLHRSELEASAEHRLAMLALATRNLAQVVVDRAELELGPPTYTHRTLTHLAEQHADSALGFIVGADAFIHIERWKHYPEVLELAHFIVVNRPQSSADALITEIFSDRIAHGRADLAGSRGGRILPLQLPPLDVSASEVRRCLAEGRDPRFMIPESVADYIDREKIYAAGSKT